jgi:transcriptional regulator with XRE-family HTH domain
MRTHGLTDPVIASRRQTDYQFAHECGINRTYLSSVERSERNVSVDNIARIARGLKVEAWKLLRDD